MKTKSMSEDVISNGTNFNFQFDFEKVLLTLRFKLCKYANMCYFSKIQHQHKAQTSPSEPCSMSEASGTWVGIRA